MLKKHEKILNDLYYSLSSPASFSTTKTLLKYAKEEDFTIKFKDVKKWMSQQFTYTLHRPVRKKFPTRPVVVYSIDEQWQADLVDLSKLKRQNKGYKYLLVVIDILSKYAWVEPLKDKTGVELKKAFSKLLNNSSRKPQCIHTDKGTEFLNSLVKSLFNNLNIKLFTTFSERKASVVERLNRTLKSIMFRYFTKNNTRKYIDVLPDLVNRYNNSFHRSIKMKPINVNKNNESRVWINLYEGKLLPRSLVKEKDELIIGDTVRISIERGPFHKGYLEGWSEEIFKIETIINGKIKVYKLKDQSGEDIKGTFYKEELQKVTEPETYRIEKVIRKKKDKNGNQLYYVKWRGYSDKFNSFVTEEDLVL